jgi:hypothetical protein
MIALHLGHLIFLPAAASGAFSLVLQLTHCTEMGMGDCPALLVPCVAAVAPG